MAKKPLTPEQRAKETERRRTERLDPVYRERERELRQRRRIKNRARYRETQRAYMRKINLDGRGKVYFIQAASGPIKIGFTTKTAVGRLRELQIGNHETLQILGWMLATQEEERALQQRFSPHQLRGEWHKPDQEILRFVANLPPNTSSFGKTCRWA